MQKFLLAASSDISKWISGCCGVGTGVLMTDLIFPIRFFGQTFCSSVLRSVLTTMSLKPGPGEMEGTFWDAVDQVMITCTSV